MRQLYTPASTCPVHVIPHISSRLITAGVSGDKQTDVFGLDHSVPVPGADDCAIDPLAMTIDNRSKYFNPHRVAIYAAARFSAMHCGCVMVLPLSTSGYVCNRCLILQTSLIFSICQIVSSNRRACLLPNTGAMRW